MEGVAALDPFTKGSVMKVFVAFAIGCVMGLVFMDAMKDSKFEEEYQQQRIKLQTPPTDNFTPQPLFEEEPNPPPPPKTEKGTWI